jgi:hypothetical protein
MASGHQRGRPVLFGELSWLSEVFVDYHLAIQDAGDRILQLFSVHKESKLPTIVLDSTLSDFSIGIFIIVLN